MEDALYEFLYRVEAVRANEYAFRAAVFELEMISQTGWFNQRFLTRPWIMWMETASKMAFFPLTSQKSRAR